MGTVYSQGQCYGAALLGFKGLIAYINTRKKIQVKVIEVHLSSKLKEKTKKAFVCLLARENRRFSSLLAALEVLPRETSAHQQQKLHTDDVFGIWSGALIGRRSSYIVLAIVYE